MCGIVAYIGFRDASPILISGLHRLEYRGYDSAGLVVTDVKQRKFQIRKKVGKVAILEGYTTHHPVTGTIGIAHTRWATHGEPNDINSHPHCSNNGRIAVVHNGIIENEGTLRKQLKQKGYSFTSETDTEVMAVLVEDIMKTTGKDFVESVRLSLTMVAGAYGLVFIDQDNPDVIVGAKVGSPLLIAFGEENNEFFIGSDASAFLEYTKKVVYLNDGEFVEAHRDGKWMVSTLKGTQVVPEIAQLEITLNSLEKGGYPYFMLKEIMEQPTSIANCLRGRINYSDHRVRLGGLEKSWNGISVLDCILNAPRIIIVACGTSFHASLVGKYFIENFAKIPVQVEYASEFRYRNPVLEEGCVLIAVSQSGETADTLAAVKMASENKILCLGLVNTVGSSISRATDAGVYLHAGPEIGVASTKAFTAQVAVFALIALYLGQESVLSKNEMKEYISQLEILPKTVSLFLEKSLVNIEKVSNCFRYAQNFLFLGRGSNYPVALEGALKLKELSYIHAEGYHASEVRHGLIALVQDQLPAVFIAMKNSEYSQTVANIQEFVGRGGVAIAITDENNDELNELCEFVIELPHVQQSYSHSNTFLLPLLTVIPLQLLSYHIAVLRGCNVDKPRNLAKAVTVE